jgi:hypothetical protein
VGWNDSSAQVSSVKDSKSNAYQLAVGPMTTGTLSQSIYYAKNISAATAGANSVTVTFSSAANFPDIRNFGVLLRILPCGTGRGRGRHRQQREEQQWRSDDNQVEGSIGGSEHSTDYYFRCGQWVHTADDHKPGR